MKILCILQNQWAENPERVQALHAKHPGRRAEIIGRMLFMGCLTGRRIEKVFGDLMQEHSFIFEEASAVVTLQSHSKPPHNTQHVRSVIERYSPDVIIAFGNCAQRAVREIGAAKRHPVTLPPVIECVHPAIQKPCWHGKMIEARGKLRALCKANPELQPA